MLGPCTTSVAPYYYQCNPLMVLLCPCSPHVVIIVPHRSPLLLLLCPYNIIVIQALILLGLLRLLYIERRSCHLYHRFHLCNVKEVSPLKRLIFKSLIYLFFYFVSQLHNIWYHSFGFQGFATSSRSPWHFRYNFCSKKFQKLKLKPI